MTARPSLLGRAFTRRAARVAIVFAVALLPLTIVAQRGAPPQAKAPASANDLVIAAEHYQTPQKELAEAVLAPRYLNDNLSNLSPDKKWFLKMIGDGPVVMTTFSKPFDELGGVFIDWKANRSRTLTISNSIGIQLISAADGTKKNIQLPAGARVSNATWSPDGKSIAFYVHGDTATHIWIANAATGQSSQLTTTPVLATLVTNFDFAEDGRSIATVLPPDNRGPRPVEAAPLPAGPEVEVSAGVKASLRTFPSLMSTPQEFALLHWHATGQLAIIDVATKAVRKIGAPTMIRAIDLSPDGQYVRVTRMIEPFSYMVPVSNFGSVEEVWDLSGKPLAQLSNRPINLGASADDSNADPNAPQAAGGGGRGRGGVTGKRELAWRLDGPGLTYLEQEPAPARTTTGDDANAANAGNAAGRGGRGAGRGAPGAQGQNAPPRKDRLMAWMPPFDAASAKLIYENPTTMANARFSPDNQILFFNETAGGNTTLYAVYLNDAAQRYSLQVTRGGGAGRAGGGGANAQASDDPNTGGSLVGVRGTAGGGGRGGGGGFGRGGGGGAGPVMLSADKAAVYFEGTTYDKDPLQVGPKSFVDRVTIKTGEKTNLYTSDNTNQWERVSQIVDADAKSFIVVRESPKDVPQAFLVSGASKKQLTDNKDIAPDLTAAPKMKVPITRPDGFHFTVRVTLPPGYQPGTKLPALFWVYPSEYETQDSHDRTDRTYNKNTFENFGARSMEFFCRLGYAVIEDAPDHLPIVGANGKENDNYVDDLRSDLLAVIDELDRRGVIDRTRLAIGGHSYGAFTTVNAMTHTTFFKAGIAGDGNYNRTLTPFGFQNERRTFWEAPDVYYSMSPLFYAQRLSGALLMYHNMHDQNVGTDPINSDRLFQALSELGKTVALYRYPFEDHGPVAKETLLDMWARWGAWLDKYVKNAPPAVVKPAAGR
jgi:dipeptidyl aminopeptidase/acylaminoacyl peptidase